MDIPLNLNDWLHVKELDRSVPCERSGAFCVHWDLIYKGVNKKRVSVTHWASGYAVLTGCDLPQARRVLKRLVQSSEAYPQMWRFKTDRGWRIARNRRGVRSEFARLKAFIQKERANSWATI